MNKKPETEIEGEYPPAREVKYSIFLAPLLTAKFEEMWENATPVDFLGGVEKKSLRAK